MILKLQSLEEGRELFYRDMQRDFPENEIKPWDVIENMVLAGEYDLLSAWEEDKMVGYAWMFVPEGESILLDYLAVLPEYRGRSPSKTLEQVRFYRKTVEGLSTVVRDMQHKAGGAGLWAELRSLLRTAGGRICQRWCHTICKKF